MSSSIGRPISSGSALHVFEKENALLEMWGPDYTLIKVQRK